jgi:hypothetical protein
MNLILFISVRSIEISYLKNRSDDSIVYEGEEITLIDDGMIRDWEKKN